MKKTIRYFFVIFCLVFAFTLSVRAEDSSDDSHFASSSSDNRGVRGGVNAVKEKFREKKEEIKDKFQEKRDDAKERFASKTAEQKSKTVENIKKRFAYVILRFNNTVERLGKISDKIQSRIDKLKGRGVETTYFQAALNNCSDEKAAAVSAISTAKSKVDAIEATSLNVKDAVQTAEGAAKGGREAIGAYRKCLIDVTKTIRASVPKEGTTSAE